MKYNIKNCFFLKPFRINAIVLYPFTLFADKNPDIYVCNHERIHHEQIKSLGVCKFYGIYLKEYLRGRLRGLSHHQSYREISFEKEAYRHQTDLHYSVVKSKTLS